MIVPPVVVVVVASVVEVVLGRTGEELAVAVVDDSISLAFAFAFVE